MKIYVNPETENNPEPDAVGTLTLNARIFSGESCSAREFLDDDRNKLNHQLYLFLLRAGISNLMMRNTLIKLINYVATRFVSSEYSPGCALHVRFDIFPEDDHVEDREPVRGVGGRYSIDETGNIGFVDVSSDCDPENEIEEDVSSDYNPEDEIEEDVSSDYDPENEIEEDVSSDYNPEDEIEEDVSSDYDPENEIEEDVSSDYDPENVSSDYDPENVSSDYDPAFQEYFDETSNIQFRPASKLVVKSLKRKMYDKKETGKENKMKTYEEECTICLEEFKDGGRFVTLPCGHEFDEECCVKWLETSHLCPLCRYELLCEDQ